MVEGGQRVEKVEDVILGDGVEQARGYDEALQCLADGRADDADQGRIRERIPNDLLDDVAGPASPCQSSPVVLVPGRPMIALKVLVVRDHAPQYHERGVHEEAEDDGAEGSLPQILRGIPQDVRPVKATEDPREAREEHAEHVSEVGGSRVVAAPICLEGLPAEAGDVRVVLYARRSLRCVRGQEEPEIKHEQGGEYHQDEDDA
mmetsp:Transcript_133965/g.428090  ORF Transcript_133965/g.428090 Transcript_133965/m.428090 type:complete len:204 (+) Transcript_133965:2231-2842(+)